MNQTQSQTSLPTTDKYRAGLAKGVWKKDGNEGEAPIPTDAELLSVSPDHFHLEAPGFVDLRKFHSNLCAAIGLSIREGGSMGKNDTMKKFKKQWDDGIVLQLFSLFTGMLQQAASSKTVPDNMVEIYEHLQSTWKNASEIINIVNSHSERKTPLLPHPLEYTMRAWQQEQRARSSREYEKTHPGSTLPEKSVASVRYPVYEIVEEPPTPSIEVPSAGQLLFPSFERKIYLPEHLPLQIIKGFDMTGRNGVLPYGMRFFFEVGMSLKPKARKGCYTKTLFDAAVDIGIVDPDSDKESKKYLRTEHKRAIANAIEVLNIIRLPYREKVGGDGLWLPFRPKNVPTRVSEKDFPIQIEVDLPPDDTRGVLVTKKIIRSLYQHLAQLNAYLAACAIFNRYGISPEKKLINPTEPDPNTPRLESGQYVNPNTGKPIFTKGGKPVTNLFAKEVLAVARRVYRKEADNYPTLDEEEIMRAAYPHEPWKQDKKWKRWADKAWEAWEAIAEKEYVRIERKGNGLQIVPSDYHVRLHHEILDTSKKSKG